MPKVEISRAKIIIALESKAPKTLTEVYRILGGTGKLSGSVAHKIRETVPGIEKVLSQNKAAATLKAKRPQKSSSTLQISGKSKKAPKESSKTVVARHSKNPFRPGSGYGLLVDIIAAAGPKGIGKEDLQKKYVKYSGKDMIHTKYDMAVINSASKDGDKRHKSCKDGFTIIKTVDNFRIRFV